MVGDNEDKETLVHDFCKNYTKPHPQLTPIAATTKSAKVFSVEKYLIWNTTVNKNQATGMEKKISKNPTNAKNHDEVLILIQQNTKAKLKSANNPSCVTIPSMLEQQSPFRIS